MTALFAALSFVVAVAILLDPLRLDAQSNLPAWRSEWDKTLAAAKKEGKVAISIPASAEMRKQLEENFKKRYGIEVEVFTARGSAGILAD